MLALFRLCWFTGRSAGCNLIPTSQFNNKTSLILKAFLTTFIIIIINIFSLSNGFCALQSISPESVLQKQKAKEDILLIDVRNLHDFEKFRIPGSLNIPLFALKTKTFLKSKPLVLINEGRGYKELINEGVTLSKAGFAVSILDGGMRQWQQKNGPIEGDVFAARHLSRLSPQVFSAGIKTENWIIIDVSQNTGSEKPGKQIKAPTDRKVVSPGIQSIPIPFSSNEKAFIPRIKAVIKDHKEKEFLSLVLCDEKGKGYEGLEKQLQAAGISNVFYLEGGLEAYLVFESRQDKMAQSISLGTGENGPQRCPSCK